MECPKCGAGNPDYAVYCGSCSALIKEPEKPRYRGERKRRGSRIVIEDRWTWLKRSLKTAVPFIVIVAIIMLSIWLYMHVKFSEF